ncbi:MAG: glucose-6-phosphate isomerase, partial [Oceanisphaera sp.]
MQHLEQQLTQLAEHESSLTLAEYFSLDPERFKQLSFALGEHWLLDFSKQRISPTGLGLLCNWAREQQLESQVSGLFSDNLLNHTEGRAVLH